MKNKNFIKKNDSKNWIESRGDRTGSPTFKLKKQ